MKVSTYLNFICKVGCKLTRISGDFIFSATRGRWTCRRHQRRQSGLLMSNFSPNQSHHCFLSYFPSGGINLLLFCLLTLSSATCCPHIARIFSAPIFFFFFCFIVLPEMISSAQEWRPTNLICVIRKGFLCVLQHCRVLTSHQPLISFHD